ncbi:MAG TPA: PH domain-containing protein [Roseiflexaceae bacterium]|nr:PH domain-containing protein [Roseiflexaceae bacterium]
MLGILKPNIELELDEGERIIYYTRRHWVLLVIRVAIPLAIATLSLALAFYRAIGGVFFALDVAPQGRLVDPSNIIFLLLIGAILFWWISRNRKKKTGADLFVNALVVFGVLVLGFVVYFRYQGGRVFSVDPTQAGGGDIITSVLFLGGLLALGLSIYTLLDWANDFLILTNIRVVYDDTQLLVRHVQQDILIDNIQQVNLSAESYLAYFLGYLALWRDQFLHFLGLRSGPPLDKVNVAYGKLVIGSLSARRLVFDWANKPVDMQAKINAELGQLRRRQAPELLRQIIEDQIYENKRPPAPKPTIFVEERAGPIPWIFHSNPEIQGDQVTWRPYWIFLALAMFPAIAVLALATVLLSLASRVGIMSGGVAFAIWLPIALVCIGRIIWVREEHENDKYILQLERIIDVDKKPFGPESSRVAPLGNIQDISFDQSFVESILGYGDVSVLTGGAGGKFTFLHVPDPRGVQATINDYLTDFKKRERERAQQATLDILKQYHALQKDHGELHDDAELAALVNSQVSDLFERELPTQLQREIASQVSQEVGRRVVTPLRRELVRSGLVRRTGLFRRRRSR